jgi:excisionase family DNA binding protein
MPDRDANLPLVLTVEEAAEALRISRGSAYELVRTGVLPHVRLGRTIRVPRHLLLTFLGVDQAEDDPDASCTSGPIAGNGAHPHPGGALHSQEDVRDNGGHLPHGTEEA